MNALYVILPILVGGLIGYFTNYIAIKMLFRPHKAVYIGGHQLPFTPGIIPKNQKRLAHAVGDAVADQLLTKDAVLGSLGDVSGKTAAAIADRMFESGQSVAELLPKQEEGADLIGTVSERLAESLVQKADETDLNAAFSRYGKGIMQQLLGSSPMLAMLVNEDLQNRLFSKLADGVRKYLHEGGKDTIRELVSSYLREQSERPIGSFVTREEDRERVRKALESAVRTVIEKHGADFLEKMDVRGIVSRRIEEMDMDELEELTMSVMKQELQAVINLGAVIGCVIGIVNVFL